MLLGEFKMRLGLAMLSILLLAGCSKTMGTAGTNVSACSVWKDISWATKDTPQTITEVKVNNARREGFCKGEK
jgi:hypothetical protein